MSQIERARMNHSEAERMGAAESYLLNELTPEQRAEFEEHLFDCPSCAEVVRLNAIAVQNIAGVFRENPALGRAPEKFSPKRSGWFSWLHPATLAPTFAALVLALIVGYQNFVSIPRLEQPAVLTPVSLAAISRDAEPQVVTVNRSRAMFNVNFEVDSPEAYPSYICEFRRAGKGVVLTMNSGPEPVASFTLSLLLPAKRFSAAQYEMILRPASDPSKDLRQYDFVVRDEGK